MILRQQNIGMSFNPGNLVPLGNNGTVYHTGSFTGLWGKITITDRGALMSPDFRELRVPAPTNLSGPQIKGPGCVLDLADGWQLGPSRRSGDIDASLRK